MVGLFAGRGDVVLAMGILFIAGLYIGYKIAWFVCRKVGANKGDKHD